jgi:4-hydroxythreonine-4-phosphate dehydrogenase
LIRDFSINKPKIAVLGLNPHCGDGVIGTEDDLILSQP